MSVQSQRVLRLVRLREQQHLLTAVELRTAKHMLQNEDDALARVGRQVQGARDDFHHAQQTGVVDDWLLACAETELCKAASTYHVGRRVTAQKVVDEAARFEAAARTASKQMQRTFEQSRFTEACNEARAEQMRLDEVVRNLRAFSTNRLLREV